MKLEITIQNGDITTIRTVALRDDGAKEAQYFARMLLSKLPIEAWLVQQAEKVSVVIEPEDVQAEDHPKAI